MRTISAMSCAVLAACLVLLDGTDVSADETKKAPAKKRKESQRTYAPFRPSLAVPKSDTVDAAAGDTKNDTITVYQNELGQTVYSIKASRFDISPPLLELAAATESRSGKAEDESGPEEDEHDTEPPSERPLSSLTRTRVLDPVVQSVIQPGLAAPTTGFNFEGVPQVVFRVSDSNGSVGNNQFVETVNSQYQVWSLNRATQTATPLFPSPVDQSALWGAGFGGLCTPNTEGNYADAIVLYDKIANRWLISTFSQQSVGGSYYQCVAVSTTANATGTYARYAFAVPNGRNIDYTKIGVWPDAYYVTATSGGAGFSLYAAMDRAKMLQADPAATWIVFQDPFEAYALPADVDGFATPPRSAPGIFVLPHDDGLYAYRMKVSFASPGSTTKTLQAIVPVAPYTGACNNCIPQPGSPNLLHSVGRTPMFRAAYRNYIDHESLVVTQSVDPGVSGLVAGVRWYDFRLSGTPDPACPTYPCVYQEGTIADVPNGRNRWLASMAMDSAENALVGYSVSGKTDGIENHSQRYTGRAKGDPKGLMTAPETTVATGTGNSTISYWGDYCSMSVDPFDDCTFWYVSQYFTPNNTWTTRIASAAFPTGSGPGQCQPTTCTSRPFSVPLNPAATVPGNNQIKVTWTGITPQPGSYALERAQGTCGAEGLYQPIGFTSGSTVTYTDTTVQAGITYAYRVRAATDAFGRCNGTNTSACANATATGVCTLKPSFAGATGAAGSPGTNCGVTVSWTAAASRCPLTPSVRYNIYRGTVPDFAPAAANRTATCVLGPSSYVDTDNLQNGTTYYYAVRAEDSSTGNGGPCGGGNEEANVAVVSATPYGAGTQAAPGTWMDGGGDGSAFLQLNRPPPGGGFNDAAWRIVKTVDDPGANHTPGGTYAYRNAGPDTGSTYFSSICAEIRTPALTLATTTVKLKYWERHQLDYRRDAVAVEYSVNGGTTWTDVPAPSDSPALGCDAADDTTGWEALSCTQDPPVNACNYPDTKNAFSGPLESGTSCGDFATSGSLTPYAHRCHQITGLTPNDTISFRWRFASDQVSEFAGFYLDDVAVTDVKVPNACAPNTCVGQVNGTSCSDGNACTVGDICGSGLCTSGSSAAPAETQSVTAAADKATYTWAGAPSATRYDAVRGLLSALPVGPGGGDEICFADLAGPTLVDAAVPAPDTGYWYLSRGENDCGAGTFGTRSNGSPRNTTTCP